MKREYPFNLLTEYLIDAYNIDTNESYQIESINARDLIVPERIDIMAKWAYIDCHVNNVDKSNAIEMYTAHLDAFSYGSFIEPGNERKKSIERYLKIFDELIEDILYNGFDEKKSIIPVGKNGEILDGSHRVAIAAYFNMEVTVIRFPKIERNFGTDFFRKNLLNSNYLNTMVTQYLAIKENCYFACLWPISYNLTKLNTIKEIISNYGKIIHIQEIELNYNGLKNFMSQIYKHQSWVGTYENNFSGVNSKAKACFLKSKPMRTIVFHAKCLEDVLEIKKQIRDLYQLQNHSIHISDNDEESRQMAQLLYNKNSLHHLNYGKPCSHLEIQRQINVIKKMIKNEEIDDKNLIIGKDGSMAIYGIDEFKEITEINIGNRTVSYEELTTNIQDKVYCNHPTNAVCFSSHNYFIYDGIKFIALSKIIENKNIKREEEKLIKHFIKKQSKSFFSEERILEYERKHKLYRVGLLSNKDYIILRIKNIFK